jgi:uncharacterized membrane protein YgdD (TMEM256/DUF423 family)
MRVFGILGASLGGLAVVAGAFGAHGLKSVLPPESLSIFETAARYQMYHALALIALARMEPQRVFRLAGWLLFAGIVIFSGSLYALALTSSRWLGAVTPLGGLSFIAGWACLAIAFARPASR